MIEHLTGVGWFAAPNAIFDHDGLTPYEILIYLYLCRRAGPDGSCWPSYATICNDCKVSRTTAGRAIAALQERGLVIVERRVSEKGDPESNAYHITQGVVSHRGYPISHRQGGSVSQTGGVVSEGRIKENLIKENPFKEESDRSDLEGSERFDINEQVWQGTIDEAWEIFKATYPKPFGGLDAEPARRQFHARCMESDCPIQEMLDGAKRYKEFCERNDVLSQFTMKAARFLERTERAWEREWDCTIQQAQQKGWLDTIKK